MKKFIILFFALLLVGQSFAFNCPITPAEKLPEYYAPVDGESGKELLDAIQQVAKIGYRSDDFRYDSCWYAFKHTDIRPDGYIWEVYSTCVFEYEKDRTSTTSQTGECKGYNREHVMCQSWFGTTSLAGKEMSSSKKNSPGSDIFHIYPASYGMNSRHGNRPYGEVATSDYTSANNTKYGKPVSTISVTNSVAGPYVEGKITLSTNVLEPADEYKGDFARSCFGTMVKWAGEWAFNLNENGRVIFDETIDADTHYGPENNYGFTNYGLALMLKWHRQDPVSQKEVDRNNGIQKTQGNRNPFIDYPYLAEYIWGERSGEVLDFEQLLCSADERFELGVSNGYLGGDIEIITDTVFWMVGDSVYTTTVVKSGASLRNLPQAPASCSEISTTFMGWTVTPMVATSDDAPALLYTKTADFPAVSGNLRYYAVFAQELRSEKEGQTIIVNKSDSTGWTLSNLKQKSNNTDGAYWILAQEASIVSPVVDLATLDSISMNIRSYQSRTTVSISVDGNEVGTLSAATNTIQRYVWTAPDLSGNKSVTFKGVSSTASYGVGINEIAMYLAGEESTYTNYLTHCASGPATILTTPDVNHAISKIIRNGQLLIIHKGKIYNTLGNNITQH